jgi:hypothetical protein
MYDGNGSDNCFSMAGVTSTFPADGSTFAGCSGPNAFSQSVQNQMLSFIGKNALHGWKKHPHPAMKGYTPLEVFGSEGPDRAHRRRRAAQRGAGARARRRRPSSLGDNYFAPKTPEGQARHHGHVEVARLRAGGRRPRRQAQVRPKGVKKFHSEAASTDYSFKRKLKVAGTYKLVCTLHHEMRMTIKVRK